MADKYAIAAGGNWSAAGTWALTDGGAGGAGAPSASENAFFSNLSGNVVVDSAATCLNLDTTKGTGYTGALSGSAGLTCSGSFTLSAGMTRTWTGALTFNATTTGQTITTAGKYSGAGTAGSITFNGVGGGWTFLDALNNTSNTIAVTLTNGALVFGAFSHKFSQFLSNNTNTRTVNISNATISVTGNSGWQINSTTGLTLTVTGSTIIHVGGGSSGGMLVTAGQTYETVTCNAQAAGGDVALSAFTCTNLNLLVGIATKTETVTLSGDVVVNGVLKYLGNSATNRMLVKSDVTGTARTLTASNVDAASDFCDFRDIAFVPQGSPTAAITGSSLGNCGGNSGITFTTPATQTSSGGGTASWSWSTLSVWAGSPARVPLPQDDVVINNAFVAGRTITCDMPRMGNNITCTCTGNPIWTWNAGNEWFGSLTFAAGMTQGVGVGVTWRGRGASNLTSNGVAFGAVLNFDGFGGTLTNVDAFNCTGTSSAQALNSGTWDLNDFSFSTGNRLTFTAPFIMRGRSSTLTLNQTPSGGTIWIQNASTCFVRDTSTVKLTFTDSVKKSMSFAAGCSLNVLQLAGSGIWSLALGGAGFTVAKIQNDRAGSSIVFLNGATYTLDGTGLAINGIAPVGGDQSFGRFFAVAANNTHSSPDAAANRITGDHAGMVKVSPVSVAQNAAMFCKSNGGGNLAFEFIQNASGALNFKYTQGGTIRTDASTVTQASIGAAAGSDIWFGWSHTTADGVTKFWWSNDGSAWTQMGTNVAGTAGALTDFAQAVEVGGRGSAQIFEGRIYRAKLFNGIPPAFGGGASASPVVDYNPADYASGNTWVSGATAETWTINGDSIVNATNRNAISSATSAAFTLTKSGGGHVSCNYITVRNSTASPRGSPDETFFATNSTDGGGNTGWNFYAFTYYVALDPAAFTWASPAQSFYADRVVPLAAAAFTWAAPNQSFYADRTLALAPAAFTWSAPGQSFYADRVVALAAAQWVWSGEDESNTITHIPGPRFRIRSQQRNAVYAKPRDSGVRN